MSIAPAGESPATSADAAASADIIRMNMGTPQAAPAPSAEPAEAPQNTPAPSAEAPQSDPQDTPDAEPADKGRAGGAEALRADLVDARRGRQAAESARDQAQAQLRAVLQALGLGDKGETQDPAAVAERAAADALTARREAAVVRHMPRDSRGNPIADADALLDSRTFTDAISSVDPTDTRAIRAVIEAHVKDHPNAQPVRYGAGSGDIAASGEPSAGVVSMDDLIRGRQ